MIITKDSDLTGLVGKRVCVERDGVPVQYGTFESLRHSDIVPDSCGGMLLEDPHPGCRGGMTGFNVPYGSRISVVPTNRPRGEGKEYWHANFRFRVWTAANGLRFDDMPEGGGPSLVPLGGWVVSYTVPMGWKPEHADVHDGKVQLRVWRGDVAAPTLHELHESRHATMREAERAAYEAGLLGFMVYETQEHRYPALNGF